MLPTQSRRTLEFRSPAFREAKPVRKESGFYTVTHDEFAGLENLDREELDEDDGDAF